MESINEIASRNPAYLHLATKGFPDGAVGRCKVCGVQRSVLTSEIAIWIRKGIPKHCGQIISLEQPPKQ
jgi:hypothetical protein